MFLPLRLKNFCVKAGEFLRLVFTSPTSESKFNENIMDIMDVGIFIFVSLCEVALWKGYRVAADVRLCCND